jgi:hypothetical protein
MNIQNKVAPCDCGHCSAQFIANLRQMVRRQVGSNVAYDDLPSYLFPFSADCICIVVSADYCCLLV